MRSLAYGPMQGLKEEIAQAEAWLARLRAAKPYLQQQLEAAVANAVKAAAAAAAAAVAEEEKDADSEAKKEEEEEEEDHLAGAARGGDAASGAGGVRFRAASGRRPRQPGGGLGPGSPRRPESDSDSVSPLVSVRSDPPMSPAVHKRPTHRTASGGGGGGGEEEEGEGGRVPSPAVAAAEQAVRGAWAALARHGGEERAARLWAGLLGAQLAAAREGCACAGAPRRRLHARLARARARLLHLQPHLHRPLRSSDGTRPFDRWPFDRSAIWSPEVPPDPPDPPTPARAEEPGRLSTPRSRSRSGAGPPGPGPGLLPHAAAAADEAWGEDEADDEARPHASVSTASLQTLLAPMDSQWGGPSAWDGATGHGLTLTPHSPLPLPLDPNPAGEQVR